MIPEWFLVYSQRFISSAYMSIETVDFVRLRDVQVLLSTNAWTYKGPICETSTALRSKVTIKVRFANWPPLRDKDHQWKIWPGITGKHPHQDSKLETAKYSATHWSLPFHEFASKNTELSHEIEQFHSLDRLSPGIRDDFPLEP